MNTINIPYFLTRLKEFCEQTLEDYSCGYDLGPFIPYVMPRYYESNLKIMYCGRDTYWWCPYEKLLSAYRNNSLQDYLKDNINCVDVDKMLEWKNNSGSFWTFVDKLHLYIRTHKYIDDITQISDDEYKILEEIGYSNLFSIELPNTLQKEERGVWNSFSDEDQVKYWNISRSAAKFENIKTLIDAYSPDILIITSWTDKDDFFEGTDFEWQKDYFEEGIRSVFLSKTYKTKVIWTCHPNRFKFLSTNIPEMCTYIGDTVYRLTQED